MPFKDEIEALLPTTLAQVEGNPALIPQAVGELRQAVLAIAEQLGNHAQNPDDDAQWINYAQHA